MGILPDDTDPMVSVMKVEKAPLESYADIGGLESQVSIDRCNKLSRVGFLLECINASDSRN